MRALVAGGHNQADQSDKGRLHLMVVVAEIGLLIIGAIAPPGIQWMAFSRKEICAAFDETKCIS